LRAGGGPGDGVEASVYASEIQTAAHVRDWMVSLANTPTFKDHQLGSPEVGGGLNRLLEVEEPTKTRSSRWRAECFATRQGHPFDGAGEAPVR
jgi:hypothetical protein